MKNEPKRRLMRLQPWQVEDVETVVAMIRELRKFASEEEISAMFDELRR